jgi:hypothetical protein
VEGTDELEMIEDIRMDFCDKRDDLGASAFLVKFWIEDCQHNHAATCEPLSVDSSRFPRRLVDLPGLKLQSNLRHSTVLAGDIKVTAVDPARQPEYVAVSYRWPRIPSRFHQLCPYNRETFARGYSVRKLPELYQDAFTLAIMIGYRYLWIHALVRLHGAHGCGSELMKSSALFKGMRKTGISSIYQRAALMVAFGDMQVNSHPASMLRYFGDEDSGIHHLQLWRALGDSWNVNILQQFPKDTGRAAACMLQFKRRIRH